MATSEGASRLDIARMDADFDDKCGDWIRVYRLQFGDANIAIRRHAALAEFVDCVIAYIHERGATPVQRHDTVVQAKSTIRYLEPHELIAAALIEEFYYSLVMKLLDDQYGNSMPKTEVDVQIDQVRKHTAALIRAG